jgi:ferrous iron transport protein A
MHAQVVPAAALTLDQLAKGQEATVVAVQDKAGVLSPELLRRLVEIGFLPGERVRVVARGFFGGNPVAVRVGNATFALRLMEARCVQISTERR